MEDQRSPTSGRFKVARIFTLNAGIVLLMVGMVGQLGVPGLYACTVIGALVIGAMVAWRGVYLMEPGTPPCPSRFGW